jgi:hypothetical protein
MGTDRKLIRRIRNMTNRIVFIIIIIALLISCNKNIKNENNIVHKDTVVENKLIDYESNPTIKDLIKEHIKENLMGYYISDTLNIIYVFVEENDLMFQKFNIINNEHIYEEIIRFNFDTHKYKPEEHLFTNNDNSVIIKRNYKTYPFFYEFTLTVDNHEQLFPQNRNGKLHFREGVGEDSYLFVEFSENNFMENSVQRIFMTKEIKEITEYTYDYQKQFVGQYLYDSSGYFNMDAEEYNTVYNNVYSSELYTIFIDDDGFLFEEKPYYETRYYQKIINNYIFLFAHSPAFGYEYFRYFLNEKIYFIIYEMEKYIGEIEENEIKGRKWGINKHSYAIYKKNNLE